MQKRIVMVFAGRRDDYQVVRAFSDAGWKVDFVTDFALSSGNTFASLLARVHPKLQERLVDLRNVRVLCPLMVATESVIRSARGMPSSVGSAERLGRFARYIASRKVDVLFSYSTYAYSAFRDFPSGNRCRPAQVLFQMHPHANECVSIISGITGARRGIDNNVEWEFRLSGERFYKYCNEWRFADRIIAASSFTKFSLIKAGASADKIAVIPYGATLPKSILPPSSMPGPLRLLYVGSFVRRKGALDLAKAVSSLPEGTVEVHACGRGLAEEEVNSAFKLAGVRVHWNASDSEVSQLRALCDVFVFPSLLEGFGLVITESMASGLPVIATSRTCAPDVISEGNHGWIVEAGNWESLAERLRWCSVHLDIVRGMRSSVTARALELTWARFRERVVAETERALP